MPDTYLAVTIGPIYKFMQEARKTRELWCISFTFSRLMKHLIDTFSKEADLISPDNKVEQPLHGAGVFPDRCYFKLKNNFLDDTDIQSLKQESFQAFINETGIDEKASGAYQIYIVQAFVDANPIGELNKMLDALELQQLYHQQPILNWNEYWSPKFSKDFFRKLYNKAYAPDDILPVLEVGNDKRTNRFPSIPEISTHELAVKQPDRYWNKLGYQKIEALKKNGLFFTKLREKATEKQLDEDEPIIQAIKEGFPDDFLTRHKYFSVIQADGDNVGKLIEAIEEAKGNLADFSAGLNRFAKRAADLLVIYGAFPVYIGGDDLLFFAPLANNYIQDQLAIQFSHPGGTFGNVSGNNLFFLLSRLNVIFKEELYPVTVKFPTVPAVSLSFGVMTGYYKQPLREIQQASYDLLFYNAKKQPGKNHIAMKVQKHSGQSFQLNFTQHSTLYESFLNLSKEVGNRNLKFLNSVMYKLEDQQNILNLIASDSNRLKLFFDNNFNEAVHYQYKEFFKVLENYIKQVFDDYSDLNLEEKIDKIYSALRFVHFINAKDVND
jgi:CRISPR-associated protein Cmr2